LRVNESDTRLLHNIRGTQSAAEKNPPSNRSLRGWADWIKEHRRKLSSIYAYFNNDPEGAAVRNALTLKQFLKT
jgi:uncharacterized protein YecE (DUF72 family)